MQPKMAYGLENPDREIYECYCELDDGPLAEDETGFTPGFPLPYRVTIEVDSRQIVEIRRDWKKGDATPAAVADAKLWREYGLQDSEVAPYAANGRKYTISAWRFADATGSFAAFEEIRPKGAKPVPVASR